MKRETSTAAILVALVMVGSMFAILSSAMVGAASSLGASPAAAPPPLVAGTPTPNPASIDAGQWVNVTNNASGGVLPYYIDWYTSLTGTGPCAGTYAGSGPTQHINAPAGFTPPGTYYYCYIVTDAEQPAVVQDSGYASVVVAPNLATPTISPVSPYVDAGNTLALTASATGGTTPYSYVWYAGSLTQACTATTLSFTTKEIVVTPTATEDNFCVLVKDASIGYGGPASSALSGQDLINIVTPTLAAGAPKPVGPGPIVYFGDSGVGFDIAAAASGGYLTVAGDYVYSWYAASANASCSSLAIPANLVLTGTGPGFAVYPFTLAGSTYICYTVSDNSVTNLTGTMASPNLPPVAYSSVIEIEMNATLTAGPILTPLTNITMTISASPAETAYLVANPVGGAGPVSGYTYQWYYGTFPNDCKQLDTSIPAVTSTKIGIKAPPILGTVFYCYEVTDTQGATSYSVPLAVVTNPALVAGTPSPSAMDLDSGQVAAVAAMPTGGTTQSGAYQSYQWYDSATLPCSTGSTLILGAKTATLSITAPVVLVATPEYYCYTVTDYSNGTSAQETSVVSPHATVTFEPALVAGAPYSPEPILLDQPQSVLLDPTVTGGTGLGTYTLNWYTGSTKATACSGDTLVAANSATYLVSSPTASAYYCYTVTDGSYSPPLAFNQVWVSVNATLQAGTITGTNQYVDAQSAGVAVINLTANPLEGTAPYFYAWSTAPTTACAVLTPLGLITPMISVTPAVTTIYCVTVTDSATTPQVVTSGGFEVQVTPGPLIANGPYASTLSVTTGQSFTLTAVLSGGTTNFVTNGYYWFQEPVATSPCTGTGTMLAAQVGSVYTVSPYYSGAGSTTYYYCYRGTDNAGGNLGQRSAYSSTIAITVYPAIDPVAPTCAVYTGSGTCAAPAPASTYQMTAAPTGGFGPLTIEWWSGGSSNCQLNSPTGVYGANYPSAVSGVTPGASGTWYCYEATDGNGAVVFSTTVYLAPI